MKERLIEFLYGKAWNKGTIDEASKALIVAGTGDKRHYIARTNTMKQSRLEQSNRDCLTWNNKGWTLYPGKYDEAIKALKSNRDANSNGGKKVDTI